MLSLCPVGCLSLAQISIGSILFLYYEESLVSSNLNSKQLRFHGVRPNLGTYTSLDLTYDMYLLVLVIWQFYMYFLIFIKNYFWTLEPIIFGLLRIKLISDPSVHNDNSNLTIFGNQSISKIT